MSWNLVLIFCKRYAVTFVIAVVVRIDLSFMTVHHCHPTPFLFFVDLHLFLIYNHTLLDFTQNSALAILFLHKLPLWKGELKVDFRFDKSKKLGHPHR